MRLTRPRGCLDTDDRKLQVLSTALNICRLTYIDITPLFLYIGCTPPDIGHNYIKYCGTPPNIGGIIRDIGRT